MDASGPLVEAVPNFSEGRDPKVIEAIAAALDGDGARVLHVDANPDAHRTVVTLAGPLLAVERALFRGIREATVHIDMRGQAGEHIRVGAADVVPLVALDGTAAGRASCVAAARRLGARVADELGVPVFLYEDASARPRFRSLPRCRRGGYEGLAARFAEGGRSGRDGPDLGPREWTTAVARTGASVIGARGVLVALNFTLATTDVELARRIAASIRAVGPDGRPERLAAVRAVGWTMVGYRGRAQVSTNLLEPATTSVSAVQDAIHRLARAAGVDLVGAELIGLVPSWVLADAGRLARGHEARPRTPGQVLDLEAADDDAHIAAGIAHLGLSHLGGAVNDLKQRTLESRLRAHGLLD